MQESERGSKIRSPRDKNFPVPCLNLIVVRRVKLQEKYVSRFRDLKPDASQVAFDLDFDFLERRGPSELVTTLKAVARLGPDRRRAGAASG